MSLVAKSKILLVFLSVFSLSILISIWVLIPDNIELGGLLYIFVEMYLSVALCFIVIVSHKKLANALQLPQVSDKWFVFFPVIPNLIVGYWFTILPIVYSVQYIGFYPDVQLVSEAVVRDYSNVSKPEINYEYTLQFKNKLPIKYENISIFLALAFLGDEAPIIGEFPMLGSSAESLLFTDGKAEMKGSLPIDLFDLHCRNYNFSKKLQLAYNFTNPPKPEKVLEVSLDIDERIKQEYNFLVAQDALVGKTNRALPECPDWTEKFAH
ncbi:hypothetical protein KBC89_02435 [Candidatus Woesebacteria bacterium]|nr:hypothetical protein [Candidatus Woesebacteria bacterium]